MHYLFNEEISEETVNNLVEKLESTDKQEEISKLYGEL